MGDKVANSLLQPPGAAATFDALAGGPPPPTLTVPVGEDPLKVSPRFGTSEASPHSCPESGAASGLEEPPFSQASPTASPLGYHEEDHHDDVHLDDDSLVDGVSLASGAASCASAAAASGWSSPGSALAAEQEQEQPALAEALAWLAKAGESMPEGGAVEEAKAGERAPQPEAKAPFVERATQLAQTRRTKDDAMCC